MTAKIDIRTPSGQSLEGFPVTVTKGISLFTMRSVPNTIAIYKNDETEHMRTKLHKGDIITIEVIE